MKLPLQDNGQEIKQGDTHFILHGVYHGIEWINGEPYRPRVEMLVIKDGRQVFLRKYDEVQGHGYNYRLPGGSLDSDADRMTQAMNETNEEALLGVENVCFSGVQYVRNYKEGFLLKNGDICIAYKGESTDVYTSKYIGKYDKKVIDKEDLDNDMAKNGKFYYITSVMNEMMPEHLEALLQNTSEVDDDIKRQIRLRTFVSESKPITIKNEQKPVIESEASKKPVYLVSCGYNKPFSNAVRAYTKSQYNHCAISLDDTLNTLYTFRHNHFENGKYTGGFEVESLKYIMRLDKDAIIKINAVMVEEDKFDELQKNINKLIVNMRDTKYDTMNLLRTFLHIEMDDSSVKDDTLTCSEFVAKMLYNLGIKISDKPINLTTPDDIANSDIAYHSTGLYVGSAKGYKSSKLKPIEESFILEVKRSNLPSNIFGIPEQRKYPLDTKKHVISAIKLFNHVDPQYEKTLAKNIISKIKEYDIRDTEIKMTDKNRFSKYYKKATKESVSVVIESDMPKDELLDKIEKLIKAKDSNVANFGREAKLALLNGFGNMNDLFITFNTILFTGGLALALCIPVMVSLLIGAIAIIPFATLTSILLKQKKLIDSNIKKLDRNGKTYKSIIDRIIESDGELSKAMIESYTIVMEAPADDDLEEEESTDYTAEIDDNVDLGDDLDEEESTDYTEEIEDDDTEEDVEEEPADDEDAEEETEENETAGEEELEEEESTDYTEEVDDSDLGDDSSEETDDTDMETSEIDETAEDSDTNKNTIIKNYNLMVDFQKMFRAISDILVSLEPVIYTQPIQNSVLTQVIKNLQTIKDFVVRYIDFNFSVKYEENLYYYGIFLQAMKFNLEILRKNDQLDNDN